MDCLGQILTCHPHHEPQSTSLSPSGFNNNQTWLSAIVVLTPPASRVAIYCLVPFMVFLTWKLLRWKLDVLVRLEPAQVSKRDTGSKCPCCVIICPQVIMHKGCFLLHLLWTPTTCVEKMDGTVNNIHQPSAGMSSGSWLSVIRWTGVFFYLPVSTHPDYPLI